MYEVLQLAKSSWPPLLKEINDPPAHLWLAGRLPDPQIYTYLTVVGSRRFSGYGRRACEHLIKGLSGYPITIVSGLALGIDAIAHEAALAAKLPTLAVPGSGLNPEVLYPRSHLNLAQKIIKAGGGLLSEFDPDFRATPYSFPQRNRLMAGLAPATLIIEAREKSGTQITARLALDYNREVLVVPGEIFNPGSVGPLRLLQDGARPVASSTDIIETLGLKLKKSLLDESKDEDISLTKTEISIRNLLSSEPLTRDQLITRLKLPATEISTALTLLEIKGLVNETSGLFFPL